MKSTTVKTHLAFVIFILFGTLHDRAAVAADKLNFIYTARVMSQSYPYIAQEAGLFKKYDLDVPVVFVTPGAPAVAAILSGDSEVAQISAAPADLVRALNLTEALFRHLKRQS